MKHINKFNESKSGKLVTDPRIKELKDIEELCVWLKDEVDNVKVEPSYTFGLRHYYSIDIIFGRDDNSIEKIVENAEKMLEITKEYTELLFKLEDSGYEITYQVLQTSQHLTFYSLTGKIQLRKVN